MHTNVNGLVLAGGKSTRMGQDKGLMRYHGKAQRYYAADLLKQYCDHVFISCRPEQSNVISRAGYNPLPDGGYADEQFGAIVSALKAHRGSAWLVVACDLPMVDAAALDYLLQQRDASMVATAYKSPDDGLPEPLLALWEPRSLDMLLSQLAGGITCPRKALIRSIQEVKLVAPQNPLVVMNANTPKDAEIAKRLIKQAGASGYVA